ncbi:class I SAM-dependent methyltransferase [Kitasatospora sp. NPDC088783]|uniref:class I SAM-dependent methyltransferase n=1 Tax=Kitasatospora sp. NPDC088783 TaxID=3364077 RepID=UPI0038239309
MDVQLDYFSQQHWNRVAEARGHGSCDVGADLAASLVATVAETAPRAVLDIGSGNGALATALATALPGARVDGLDYSDTAVRLATENARTHAAPDVRDRLAYTVGSALELPYEDGRFDAVTMLKTAWVLPDLGAALAECRRVLRPGGWIFLQSWGEPESCPVLTLSGAVLGAAISGFELPDEAMAPFELTADLVTAELAAAGLPLADRRSFDRDVPAATPAEYWEQLRSLAGTAYWAFAVQPPEFKDRLDAGWQQLSAEHADAAGVRHLPLAWHVSIGRRA